MATKINRVVGKQVQDHHSIPAVEYNMPAGAKKVAEVGRRLLPIPTGAGTWTTNITTATGLPAMGKNLAVYNNSGSVGSVTVGNDNTVVSAVAGSVDANGNASIPCPPNAWTYIACGPQQWVVGSAATLLAYLIDDDTYIRQEASY